MAPPAVPTGCTLITGTVRSGARLLVLDRTDEKACCAHCCVFPSKCVAFVLYQNKTCELPSTEGGEHAAAGVVSGALKYT